MILPNFLIIGAAKSGTTSLHNYLKEHPQIYMSSIKEPKYFAFEEGEKLSFKGPGDMQANSHVITNLTSYSQLFAGVNEEIAIGESSPSYLYSQKAPQRIKSILPDVKIIVILRNPVARAYSNFLYLLSSNREPMSNFARALEAEENRIENNWEYFWHYKGQGFYYKHLKRYFDIFDRQNIKVCLYEDYQASPLLLLQDIFTFLDVDSSFTPNISEKYNVTTPPKSVALHQFLTQENPAKTLFRSLIPSELRKTVRMAMVKKNKSNIKPAISPEIKSKLNFIYREDIMKLQDLIQKDLSNWLSS